MVDLTLFHVLPLECVFTSLFMNRKYVHFRLRSLAKNNKKLTKQMEKRERNGEYSTCILFNEHRK